MASQSLGSSQHQTQQLLGLNLTWFNSTWVFVVSLEKFHIVNLCDAHPVYLDYNIEVFVVSKILVNILFFIKA